MSINRDGDGTEEYQVSLCSWKDSNANSVSRPILEHTQDAIWQVSKGSGSLVGAPAGVWLDGDTLIFVVNRSDLSGLSTAAGSPQISFHTYFDDGKAIHTDSIGP